VPVESVESFLRLIRVSAWLLLHIRVQPGGHGSFGPAYAGTPRRTGITGK